MKDRTIYILLKRFFEKEQSTETCKSFYTWFADGEDAEGQDEALRRIWEELPETVELDSLGELMRTRRRILRRLMLRWAAAAACFLVVAGGCLYKYVGGEGEDVRWRQCFTAYGEAPQRICLPDGSSVCLNVGSTLLYPDRWERGARRVFLSGEAHFEVAEKAGHPFVAVTARLEVEALGTVFSVRDYPDGDDARATLEEGTVCVGGVGTEDRVVLGPNEEVVRRAGSALLEKRYVDAAWMNSWREGYLIFQHTCLEDIFAAFERKYKVRISFRDSKFSGMSFTVRFHPEEGLAESLDVLRRIGADFRYKIRDRDVYIE